MQEEIDGSVVLRLKVPVSGELQRWVLQFGSEAEVLQPAALRKAVGEQLKRALAVYRAVRG
jgi:predicted DNA-binding transcriptional regulator YafY